jgi:hypothetical protein
MIAYGAAGEGGVADPATPPSRSPGVFISARGIERHRSALA